MSAETSGAGAEYRSREFIPAGVIAVVVLGGASGWLLRGWLQRRFGMAVEPALLAAVAPGVLAGIAVLWAVLRWRPRMDAEQRRPMAAAAEPKRRRHRVWVIVMLCMLLLEQLADWPMEFPGAGPGGESWSLVLLVFVILVDGVHDILPSRGATPGRAEPDQAERRAALRMGLLAMMVLGGLAAAVSVRWPGGAVRVWLAVPLAGVLAAEVRMATLPRWTARVAGDAV